MRLGRGLLHLLLPLLAACDTGAENPREVTATRAVARPAVPVPPGSVPRGTSERMAALAPPGPEATPDLVAEGRELYLVFCSPCHGGSGHGDGTVTRRGYPPPPSFHEGPAREMTAERIVTVITRGQGRMISYADRIPPRERWAVARYLKELQAQAPSPPARREAPPPAASVSPETAPWLPFVREGQP